MPITDQHIAPARRGRFASRADIAAFPNTGRNTRKILRESVKPVAFRASAYDAELLVGT